MATTKITTASRQAALPTTQFPSQALTGQTAYQPPLSGVSNLPDARHSRPLRWLFASTVALSLVALSISGYLSYVAFTSSKILGCGSGSMFDCDHVLHSKWSTMLGMPVAAWASSLYLSVLFALIASSRSATSSEPTLMRTWSWSLVTTAAVSAGLAAVWFTGLQVFVLKHLCPWCLAAHTCGLLLCIATLSFSPLRGSVKRACLALGTLGTAGLITIQLLTPPPQTYTIEEFPTKGNQVSGGAVLEAESELFDAPAEGDDVFDAPFEAPAINDEASLDSEHLEQYASDLQWARALAALWLQPAGLLTTQVGTPAATTQVGAEQQAGSEQQAGNAQGGTPNSQAGNAGVPAGAPAATEERLVPLASANLKLRAHQWPMVGSPNAKYIFVELYDYTCPHCRATQQAIRGARQHFKDDLAIITLPVPLSRACNDTVTNEHPSHRESCELARLAIAVWRIDPSKFADYHEWLLTQNPIPNAAVAKSRAAQVVGQQALDQELAQPHASRYITKHVDIYRRMNAGPIPKLIFANTTLTGEMTSPQVLIQTIERQASR